MARWWLLRDHSDRVGSAPGAASTACIRDMSSGSASMLAALSTVAPRTPQPLLSYIFFSTCSFSSRRFCRNTISSSARSATAPPPSVRLMRGLLFVGNSPTTTCICGSAQESAWGSGRAPVLSAAPLTSRPVPAWPVGISAAACAAAGRVASATGVRARDTEPRVEGRLPSLCTPDWIWAIWARSCWMSLLLAFWLTCACIVSHQLRLKILLWPICRTVSSGLVETAGRRA